MGKSLTNQEHRTISNSEPIKIGVLFSSPETEYKSKWRLSKVEDFIQGSKNTEGTMCLENGSYLWNFESCKECGKKEPIVIANRTEQEDEDEEELITYKHLCTICGHIIAEHTYTFRVDDEYQEYSMTCLLCGRGADHKQIHIEGGMPNGVC